MRALATSSGGAVGQNAGYPGSSAQTRASELTADLFAAGAEPPTDLRANGFWVLWLGRPKSTPEHLGYTSRETCRRNWRHIRQDDVAVALEQRALVGEPLHKAGVVACNRRQRLRQRFRATSNMPDVPVQIHRFSTHEDLERRGLGIQKLSAAGEHLLLCGIVCRRQGRASG